MEKVRPWCCQPSDRGRLKNRTEQVGRHLVAIIYMMHATGDVVVHPETTVVETYQSGNSVSMQSITFVRTFSC